MGDVAILLLSLAIIAASFNLHEDFSGKPEIHVRAEGREYIYDLSTDTFATFTGPVGTTTIEILDGRVHVHDSDCRNKICIAAGWISHPGEWIICLPNNVFIFIEGAVDPNQGAVDDTAF